MFLFSPNAEGRMHWISLKINSISLEFCDTSLWLATQADPLLVVFKTKEPTLLIGQQGGAHFPAHFQTGIDPHIFQASSIRSFEHSRPGSSALFVEFCRVFLYNCNLCVELLQMIFKMVSLVTKKNDTSIMRSMQWKVYIISFILSCITDFLSK